MRVSLAALAGGILIALGGVPAAAACYDVFGCSDQSLFRAQDLRSGPTCEFLWVMRNTIYQERGYCFQTPRAVSYFGNDGCRFRDAAALPMSRVERANVGTIAQVEAERGCPR